LAASVRHDSRVHLIAPLPSLIQARTSAFVVEGNDALGGAAHVRHDEADARIEFTRMPLDLGDYHAPWLRPTQVEDRRLRGCDRRTGGGELHSIL
jgi:hypothetical protein